MNILGTDNNHPSGTMENVLVENNWFDAPYSGIMVNGGKNITFNLNTFSGLGGAFLALTNNPTMGLRFTNNTTPSAQYGLFGDAVGAGVVALTKYAPDAVFVGNTIFVLRLFRMKMMITTRIGRDQDKNGNPKELGKKLLVLVRPA
jgi:hypothetical protein